MLNFVFFFLYFFIFSLEVIVVVIMYGVVKYIIYSYYKIILVKFGFICIREYLVVIMDYVFGIIFLFLDENFVVILVVISLIVFV